MFLNENKYVRYTGKHEKFQCSLINRSIYAQTLKFIVNFFSGTVNW